MTVDSAYFLQEFATDGETNYTFEMESIGEASFEAYLILDSVDIIIPSDDPLIDSVISLNHFEVNNNGYSEDEVAGDAAWLLFGNSSISLVSPVEQLGSLYIPNDGSMSGAIWGSPPELSNLDFCIEFTYNREGTPDSFGRVFQTVDGDSTGSGSITMPHDGTTDNVYLVINGDDGTQLYNNSAAMSCPVGRNDIRLERIDSDIFLYRNDVLQVTAPVGSGVVLKTGSSAWILGGQSIAPQRSTRGRYDEFRLTLGDNRGGSGYVLSLPFPDPATIVPTTKFKLSPSDYDVDFGYRDPINYRGSIVLSAVPDKGAVLQIQRSTPITNDHTFTPGKPFEAEAFEYAVDKLTFILQELEGHLCDCRAENTTPPPPVWAGTYPPVAGPEPNPFPAPSTDRPCNLFDDAALYSAAGNLVSSSEFTQVLSWIPDGQTSIVFEDGDVPDPNGKRAPGYGDDMLLELLGGPLTVALNHPTTISPLVCVEVSGVSVGGTNGSPVFVSKGNSPYKGSTVFRIAFPTTTSAVFTWLIVWRGDTGDMWAKMSIRATSNANEYIARAETTNVAVDSAPFIIPVSGIWFRTVPIFVGVSWSTPKVAGNPQLATIAVSNYDVSVSASRLSTHDAGYDRDPRNYYEMRGALGVLFHSVVVIKDDFTPEQIANINEANEIQPVAE